MRCRSSACLVFTSPQSPRRPTVCRPPGRAAAGRGRARGLHRERCGDRRFLCRGEAGIGKTRLIEECQRHAEALNFRSHHTCRVRLRHRGWPRCGARNSPRGLVGPSAGWPLTPRPRPPRIGALEEGLLRAGSSGSPERSARPAATGRAARALRRHRQRRRAPRGSKDSLAELVVRTSRRKPRLLIVEDVHWADRSHARIPRSPHADGRPTCPAVLVMTSRLDGDRLDHVWRSRIPGSPLLTIDLGPLRRRRGQCPSERLFRSQQRVRQAMCGACRGQSAVPRAVVVSRRGRMPSSAYPTPCRAWFRRDWIICRQPHRQALQAASVLGQRFALDEIRYLIERDDYHRRPRSSAIS